MSKRTERADALFDMLDGVITLTRHLERENLPAERMQMSCGHLDTPLGAVPIIDQMPYPALVRPRVEAERGTFARFGAEMPCPKEHRALLETLHAFVDAPIVCLEKAFVRVDSHSDECVLTVGTEGTPGWTNQNSFAPEVFDYLESMAEIGGLLVNFADPFDRHFQPPEPEEEPGITWWDIRRKDVGEGALALAKRPRERLILLLAIHQYMDPDEINKLNLAQVTQKFGRDYRARVYLKKRLVRKKAVAEALLQYRKRDRESFWYPKEPMFRSGKSTRGGRSMRMGAKAIEALLMRYAERALKRLPDEPTTKEPPAIPPRAPMFWIVNIAYHRTPTNPLSGG